MADAGDFTAAAGAGDLPEGAGDFAVGDGTGRFAGGAGAGAFARGVSALEPLEGRLSCVASGVGTAGALPSGTDCRAAGIRSGTFGSGAVVVNVGVCANINVSSPSFFRSSATSPR